MTKKQDITAAVASAITPTLGAMEQPAITAYQLGLMVWRFYREAQDQTTAQKIMKNAPDGQDYNRMVTRLQGVGVIQGRRDFPHKAVFNILGKDHRSSEDVACAVDPFAYLSHLSAMTYHGLTDRIPQLLFVSTPTPARWREFARERMVRDLGDDLSAYERNGLPRLFQTNIAKIGKYPVNRYASVHLGAFRLVKGRALRVATIGRTFLDMLRKPELCGGMHHALDVYEEFGKRYLNLIVDEIDLHGKNIDKVRAGYVLEERCGLRSERLESWLRCVQRGGSQKLNPSGEYSEVYSERWCLSINID